MSLRKLPDINASAGAPKGFQWDAHSRALEVWSEMPFAASNDEATISILSTIGDDPFGDGFSARRMAGALRSIGDKPVKVQINSPGGDFFEGVAIYNLLKEHKAKVSVAILGVAASAASFVAMAGDEIAMGRGALMMVHNSWGAVIGNQNDFRVAADTFEKFDASMRSIYSDRTGQTDANLAAMMDAETFMTAEEAVALKFADSIFAADPAAHGAADHKASAKHKIDAILASKGMPRSERRNLLRELTGKPGAADEPLQDAGFLEALNGLISTIKS